MHRIPHFRNWLLYIHLANLSFGLMQTWKRVSVASVKSVRTRASARMSALVVGRVISVVKCFLQNRIRDQLSQGGWFNSTVRSPKRSIRAVAQCTGRRNIKRAHLLHHAPLIFVKATVWLQHRVHIGHLFPLPFYNVLPASVKVCFHQTVLLTGTIRWIRTHFICCNTKLK